MRFGEPGFSLEDLLDGLSADDLFVDDKVAASSSFRRTRVFRLQQKEPSLNCAEAEAA